MSFSNSQPISTGGKFFNSSSVMVINFLFEEYKSIGKCIMSMILL